MVSRDRSRQRGQLGAGQPTSRQLAAGARPPPALLILATVLVLVGVLTLAFFVALVTAIETCGGDGGSPYVAPASPLGRYCESQLPWVSLVAGLAMAGAGGALAIRGCRWRPLIVGVLAGGALVLGPLVVAATLSKDCAEGTARSSADCEHY